MKIHHSTPELAGSTVLPNATFLDQRLSYTARGVLALLLSYGKEWEGTADALSRQARQHRSGRGEGRRAIRAAFAELEDVGYLVRTKTKMGDGGFVTLLNLYDTPGRAA